MSPNVIYFFEVLHSTEALQIKNFIIHHVINCYRDDIVTFAVKTSNNVLAKTSSL